MNYSQLHRLADAEFSKIAGLDYSEATRRINTKLAESDEIEHTYLWECVRCRLNAELKKKVAT